MALNFKTLDVFTDQPFKGNPLAIVQVPSEVKLSQEQKQLIAKEFNLSETVFLHEQTDSDVQKGEVRIDIFTSIAEVPFAGHPTVGTSNYLLYHAKLASAPHTLIAKAGPVPFHAHGKGARLSVPHNVRIHAQPFAGKDYGHFPVVSIVKGMTFLLAKHADLEALAKPTESLLGTANTYKAKEKLDEGWREGMVGSYCYVDLGVLEDGTRRLRTRMFASREDPATGSAASALTSYLALSAGDQDTLVHKFHITQGVEMGRQSDIHIQVTLEEGGQKVKEVLLGGVVASTVEGKIQIPPV